MRRHPADVTADRLTDHATDWDKFDGKERDAIGTVIYALREIAEGNRDTEQDQNEQENRH